MQTQKIIPILLILAVLLASSPNAAWSQSNGENHIVFHNASAGLLSSGDYWQIYGTAQQRLHEAINFRTCELQPRSDSSQSQCTKASTLDTYYADFNSHSLQDKFCQSFATDARGYCAGAGNILNRLLEARQLYATLYLVEPQNMTFVINGQADLVRDVGRTGMLEATRELAFAPMIFASEYAIDAFDYQYTLQGQAGSEGCDSEQLERYKQKIKDSIGQAFNPEHSPYDFFSEDANCVIQHELSLLAEGQKYYDFAIAGLRTAFEEDLAWPKQVLVGDLFTPAEIDVFAALIKNYITIIDAIAIRQRQLGEDKSAARDDAGKQYEQAQKILAPVTKLLLARAALLYPSADPKSQALLAGDGSDVQAGMNLLDNRLAAIKNGVDLLGFNEAYVPVQSFPQMLEVAKGLAEWSRGATEAAIGENRTFDYNATELRKEMAAIHQTFQSRLVDICGEPEEKVDDNPENDFSECIGSAGSLMEQNWLKLVSATINLNLARVRMEAAKQKIVDIKNATQAEIQVRTQTGMTMTAINLAEAEIRSFQVLSSTATTRSTDIFSDESTSKQTIKQPGLLSDRFGTANETESTLAGYAKEVGAGIGSIWGQAGAQAGAAIGGELTKMFNDLFGSTKRSEIESQTHGVRHSQVELTSVTTVFNPNEIPIAKLENLKAMASLNQDITIVGIKSGAEVHEQLRLIAALQLERELDATQYALAVAESNQLRNDWQVLSAQYRRAWQDIKANYLANPAYRLLKANKTELATYQLAYATQYAYLAAKALEYDLADKVPFINEVFKARHPDHLLAYLHKLELLYKLAPSTNETPVTFSLRVWASSIRDQDINSLSDKSDARKELDALRQARFLEYMKKHLVMDEKGNPVKLILVFDTSLAQPPFAVSSRWNWRISGSETGLTAPFIDRCPVRKSYGVSVEIMGSSLPPEGMTVNLTMSGETSTRQKNGTIIHYSPQLASLLPIKDIPTAIQHTSFEATAHATISVPFTGESASNISDFCNMSVAATTWILEVPLAENHIQYEQIQDISLHMQTFYYN